MHAHMGGEPPGQTNRKWAWGRRQAASEHLHPGIWQEILQSQRVVRRVAPRSINMCRQLASEGWAD